MRGTAFLLSVGVPADAGERKEFCDPDSGAESPGIGRCAAKDPGIGTFVKKPEKTGKNGNFFEKIEKNLKKNELFQKKSCF